METQRMKHLYEYALSTQSKKYSLKELFLKGEHFKGTQLLFQ